MILLVHLLFGAAIGSVVKNVPLAIILAFLSHYFLDFFPHIEYPIENNNKKQWSACAGRHRISLDILKIILDFCLGILLIFIFFNSSSLSPSRQLIVYICALLAILPDSFTILSYFMPNKILEIHDKFHQKVHFLEDNPSSLRSSGQIKISKFWRIFSQIIILIISVILLRY